MRVVDVMQTITTDIIGSDQLNNKVIGLPLQLTQAVLLVQQHSTNNLPL